LHLAHFLATGEVGRVTILAKHVMVGANSCDPISHDFVMFFYKFHCFYKSKRTYFSFG